MKATDVTSPKRQHGCSERDCSGPCLQDGDPENHRAPDRSPADSGEGALQAGLGRGDPVWAMGTWALESAGLSLNPSLTLW